MVATAPAAAPARQGEGHLDVLDGLRAVAIVLVMLAHVGFATGNVNIPGTQWAMMNNGTIGVPIFFALSGLLLYRPWARAALDGTPGPALRPYLWRRAVRILPAYWVMLAVAMVVFNQRHIGSARTWLEMVTLTQNYDPFQWWRLGLGPDALAPVWSLSVEVAFYLSLPLLARWLRAYAWKAPDTGGRGRRLLTGLGVMAAASFLVTAVIRFTLPYRAVFYWEHLLPRSLVYFAAGMAITVLAEWAARGGPVARFTSWVGSMPGSCWLVAGCGMVLFSTPLATPLPGTAQDARQFTVAVVFAVAITVLLIAPVAFAPAGPLAVSVLGNRYVSRLGLISYSVFLWHQLVISGWYKLSGRPLFQHDLALVLIITVAVSIPLAAAGHAWVERPAQRLRHLVR